jgi:hypothetical protein
VRGLVAVALGGGLQRLGLAAQLRRRGGDQAEDDEVEDREADAQRDRHGPHVVAHGGGHRRVGQVELDGAVRFGDPLVLQRHVDLEQLVVAVLAAGAVVGGVRETGDDVAVERGAQFAGPRGLADELGALGVVEDRPVTVEDLQLDRVEGGQRLACRPELVGGGVDHLFHVDQTRGREAAGEVGPGELRLEAEAHGHEGRVLRLLTGAVLDDGAEQTGEDHPDRDRHQQADRGETGQQARAAHSAQEPHASSIGTSSPVLESDGSHTPSEGGATGSPVLITLCADTSAHP